MLKPLGEHIVVEVAEPSAQTTSGIILPGSTQEQTREGIVVAIGTGRTTTKGIVLEPTVQIGDRILIANYAGTEVSYQGKALFLLKESEILAIVE